MSKLSRWFGLLLMTVLLAACSSAPLPQAKTVSPDEIKPELSKAAASLDQMQALAQKDDLAGAQAQFKEYQKHYDVILPALVGKDQKLAAKLQSQTNELAEEFGKTKARKSEVDEEYGAIGELLKKAAPALGAQ